jgi:hypothetical protein
MRQMFPRLTKHDDLAKLRVPGLRYKQNTGVHIARLWCLLLSWCSSPDFNAVVFRRPRTSLSQLQAYHQISMDPTAASSLLLAFIEKRHAK